MVAVTLQFNGTGRKPVTDDESGARRTLRWRGEIVDMAVQIVEGRDVSYLRRDRVARLNRPADATAVAATGIVGFTVGHGLALF